MNTNGSHRRLGKKESSWCIGVVFYANITALEACLQSLERCGLARSAREILIVNNARDPLRYCRELGELIASIEGPLRVVTPLGDGHSYARGVNAAFAASNSDVVIVCNDDIVFTADANVSELVRVVSSSGVGVAGPQLRFPDRRLQRSYGSYPSIRSGVWQCLGAETITAAVRRRLDRRGLWRDRTRCVDYVDGACMAIRRECFEALGGFDEQFEFYCEEVDFCRRATLARWRVIFVSDCQVTHIRGASSSRVDVARSSSLLLSANMRFIRKWTESPYAALAFGILVSTGLAGRLLMAYLARPILDTTSYRMRMGAWLRGTMECLRSELSDLF